MDQTESKSCNKFNSFRIVTIKREFGEGHMKLSIFFKKTETLLEFLRPESKLFYSIREDKKRRILEKILLSLNNGNVAQSSCSKWYTSYRNGIKKVF